jgi:hypothetical protein
MAIKSRWKLMRETDATEKYRRNGIKHHPRKTGRPAQGLPPHPPPWRRNPLGPGYLHPQRLCYGPRFKRRKHTLLLSSEGRRRCVFHVSDLIRPARC